jgi:SEC-C motif-containing protein
MCPCGSGHSLDQCCGRFLSGAATAPTAEALMRSRFTAFAVEDAAYLLRTWHPSTRPRRLDLDDGPTWTRLEVLTTTGGALFDAEGTVRFAAHYLDGDRAGIMREHSRFVREDGEWLYVGALG